MARMIDSQPPKERTSSKPPKMPEPFAERPKTLMEVRGDMLLTHEFGGPHILGKFIEFVETKKVNEFTHLPEELRVPENFMEAYARNASKKTGKNIRARRFIEHQDDMNRTLFVVYEEIS